MRLHSQKCSFQPRLKMSGSTTHGAGRLSSCASLKLPCMPRISLIYMYTQMIGSVVHSVQAGAAGDAGDGQERVRSR